MHEMGKEHVNHHHTADSQPLNVKGGNIPSHKMFKKAPPKKGKKGHTNKGKMKGDEKGKMKGAGKGKKKGHTKGKRGPGQRDLAGMMMKWFKKRGLKGKKRKFGKRGKKRMLGKMRKMLKKKLKHKHAVVAGRKWHLIKKHNGLCKCTKHPRGRIIVSKHESQNDCENKRNGC